MNVVFCLVKLFFYRCLTFFTFLVLALNPFLLLAESLLGLAVLSMPFSDSDGYVVVLVVCFPAVLISPSMSFNAVFVSLESSFIWESSEFRSTAKIKYTTFWIVLTWYSFTTTSTNRDISDNQKLTNNNLGLNFSSLHNYPIVTFKYHAIGQTKTT